MLVPMASEGLVSPETTLSCLGRDILECNLIKGHIYRTYPRQVLNRHRNFRVEKWIISQLPYETIHIKNT